MNEKIEKARQRAKEWVDREYPEGECEEQARNLARSAYFTALLDTIYGIYKVM